MSLSTNCRAMGAVVHKGKTVLHFALKICSLNV